MSCEIKSGKTELPSEPCPWLVYRCNQEQTFCSLSRPHKFYSKSIPALSDSIVVAHSSGWFLLSQKNTQFSLCNPKMPDSFIPLPPLSLKPKQVIKYYLLSSPPGDPDCKVLLFENRGSIIIIRPEVDKEWTHIHYAESVTDSERRKSKSKDLLKGCVSFKGKLYGFTSKGHQLVTFDVDKGNNLVVEPLCNMPKATRLSTVGTLKISVLNRLIECCGELLYVCVVFGGLNDLKQLNEVHVFKLDFDRMIWRRAENLMGQAVFLNGAGASSFDPAFVKGIEGDSVYFTLSVEKGLYSFNVKDGCLSVTLPYPIVPSSWSSPMIFVPHDVRLSPNSILPAGGEEQGEKIYEKEDSITAEIVQIEESQGTSFLDFPIECQMLIADCLNRLIPKLRHMQALQRFKTCPSSPMWLLLSINDMTAFKLVDPVHGTSFIMSVPESLKGSAVRYSRNGWLLMSDGESSMSFLNPFTEEIIKLPATSRKEFASQYAMAFTSLPTSPDCIVVGCGASPPTATSSELSIVLTTMRGHNEWIDGNIERDGMFWINNSSPVFYKESFYLLDLEGTLSVLKYEEEELNWTLSWDILKKPRVPCIGCMSFHQNFLLECDGKLMSIFVGEMEKWLEVYCLDFTVMRWKKVENIGNYVIYVSRSSSIAIEATIMGTNNRIYFPRFRDNCILYYSFETTCFVLG